MNKPTNRLAQETSPYLLQHAQNPVDWYPWSEEALEKAKQEDKPIIVSIGYSACHWCHVMEHECFEDAEVAQRMNNHFISIKVDREERPDVDQIYMEAVQMMGVQGGWPLNVFLTPDQKPFYGGTYFPKAQWMQLLQNITAAYRQERQQLEDSAEQFAQDLSRHELDRYGLVEGTLSREGGRRELSSTYQQLAKSFDRQWGGRGKAPKFPMPSQWLFLMRYYFISQNEEAQQQIMLTLDKMAYGGIYDQVGGGFARYSVDARWFAPHFEKMLYDNGQLLTLYAEAYALTQEERYRRVLEETIAFVRRELTSEEGGFYSALDADSEGEEGKFYTWTYHELTSTLDDEADLVIDYYGATPAGNWENGVNILHQPLSDDAFAQKYDLNPVELADIIEEANKKLLEARSQRIRPGLDDKILTSWNGLMLKGLVDAYTVLWDESVLEMALRNAHFLKEKLSNPSQEGALFRTYKNGEARLTGYLDDYAFVIEAFVALYQATFDEEWLTQVHTLLRYTLQHFYDKSDGLFFYTEDSSKLIARKKELFDNVIPASNSAMARNLYKLGLLLDNSDYTNRAEAMLEQMLTLLKTEPAYLSNWASLYTEWVTPTAEIAIVGPDYCTISLELNQQYYPNKLLLGTKTKSTLPLLESKNTQDGKTTIYVCYDKTCQLPVYTTAEAWEQLSRD